MNACDKPVILTFIGNYLPGYKAGGILRTIVNTVDHLCDEFEFRIVTKDRDLGDDKPYPDIMVDQWQRVGNAMVYYLPPEGRGLEDIRRLIKDTPHQMLYLNSFFDLFTIKALVNRRFFGADLGPVIVAPWGEFGWASLKQKYFKKFIFIQLVRIIGLYRNVTWRASSELEQREIINVMGVNSEAIHITGDFPIKVVPGVASERSLKPRISSAGLKAVFLSRISPEKNLDYALKVLSKVKARIVFDIYGPAENAIYWKECQALIALLPGNITVNYLGVVAADQVLNTFGMYDLFLFPTGGEAYGHVIAECLASGTPVLLSTATPWRNLEADGLGWDVDLLRMDSFVEIIERMALMSDDDRLRKRVEVKARIPERLLDPAIRESNRQLFKRG